MAIGARRGDVLGLILRQGLVFVFSGLVVGFAASLALTRFLSSMLYEVRPADFATWATVTAIITVVALGAGYIPARRAMKVDPTVALRHE
jgi:putative ABC transport system permease protein